MDIQSEHIKHRSYFIYAMCGMSLYGWNSYSLFDPTNLYIGFFTSYYQNCLLMLSYLGWDIYHMTLSKNRKILYRKDLVIHHFVSVVTYLSFINVATKQLSNVLIMECISLMNNVLKDNPRLLKIYRTICICVIRTPLSLWYLIYYNPKILFPQYMQFSMPNYYLYLTTMSSTVYIFFILYDMFILWKLYKPNKLQQ